MSTGVLFYNWGLACVPRLLVALHTFRKHEPVVPVTLMVPEGDTGIVLYCEDLLALNVDLKRFTFPEKYRKDLKITAKLWILEQSPYDQTIVYENDFLFQGPVVQWIDDLMLNVGFGMSGYHGITGPQPGTLRRLNGEWKDFPRRDLMEYPKCRLFNHGLVCQGKNYITGLWHQYMIEWEKWTIAEEHICNLLVTDLRDHEGTAWRELPNDLNLGMRYGTQTQVNTARALHYLGGRHLTGSRRSDCLERWRDALRAYIATSPKCLSDGLISWDPGLAAQFFSGEIVL